MLSFCSELETGKYKDKLPLYQKIVHQIEDWYKTNFNLYSVQLKTEAGIRAMADSRSLDGLLEFADDLSYNFGAKLSYFSISDTLVKLILSKYSYGMSSDFCNLYGLKYNPKWSKRDECWLTCGFNEVFMTEILAKVLRDEVGTYSFDLAALMQDRHDRSALTHAAQSVQCLSAIRSYNSIRSMLAFLDPDCDDTLPCFSYDALFDFDAFVSPPCDFNFDAYSTILLVGSVHDVRKDLREAVSNLPWNMVIDYDGYSDCGGLLSSLSHNQAQQSILTASVASAPSLLTRGTTYWYRCGGYQLPSYEPFSDIPDVDRNKRNILSIPSLIPFQAERDKRGRNAKSNTREILKHLIQNIEQMDRPLNIVAAIDDINLVQALIIALDSASVDNYFITWIGLSSEDTDSIRLHWYNGDEEEMNNHFRYFNCPVSKFYEGFNENKDRWNYRSSPIRQYTLPGAEGPVTISENERFNLAPYFDILYDGIEDVEREDMKKEYDSFDHGNLATWSVIANEYAVRLKSDSDFNRMETHIRTVLGILQSKKQQKLYFIRHRAGLGGTTFARQLAWDLHKEYAVLTVKNYEPSHFSRLIENLYDNTLQRAPVILLADDTLPYLKNVCDDICRLDRRCILIVSCRQESAILSEYSAAPQENLMSLQDQTVKRLKQHFRHVSQLPGALLDQRDREFDTEIVGDLRTPFIIGLYYLEEEFNIKNYVKKALIGCGEKIYQDIMACMAMCDSYNYKDVPLSLVNSASGLKPQELFLKIVSSADSVICQGQNGEVDVYRFKHHLLSSQYLEQYCSMYYADDRGKMLLELARALIGYVARLRMFQECHLNLLSAVIIQNKGEADDEGINLSALLQDVGRDGPKQLLRLLAETFQPIADAVRDEVGDSIYTDKERALLRMVSHAHAHLGRVYSRMDGNASRAREQLELALKYMPDQDPNIYHMSGNTVFDELKRDWEEARAKRKDDATYDIAYEDYEDQVWLAADRFDDASYFGSPDYGYSSKLKLLYSYLNFVYQTKNIHKVQDTSALSETQHKIQQEFLYTLEAARGMNELDEQAIKTIEDYGERYHANIMFHDYGKAVEYYQNKLDVARQKNNVAAEEIALKGLVIARINAARAKCAEDLSFYREVANPVQLADDVAALLKQPRKIQSYAERMSRGVLFHHWIQLAKVISVPLESAKMRMQQWYDMEEEGKHFKKDPEPYYYLRAINYLDAMDGSKQAMNEAKQMASKIAAMARENRFDLRKSNLERIKDLMAEGTGMGRLFDVSYCKNNEEAFLAALVKEKRRPIEFGGHLTRILNQSLGELEIYDPLCWAGIPVSIRMGSTVRNTLSEKQLNDKVRFFMGFSARKPYALADTAKDVDKGEVFDGFEIFRVAKSPQNNSKKRKYKSKRG